MQILPLPFRGIRQDDKDRSREEGRTVAGREQNNL